MLLQFVHDGGIGLMPDLTIVSFAQMTMTFTCPKCSSAIGTTLCFDGEDGAVDHRRSELHTVVLARSDPEALKQFALQLKKEKPKDKTGSEFSKVVQWQFVLLRQALRIEAGYREQDRVDTKVHFP